MKERALFYEAPALAWEEALPLGNGILGMMVYGGITEERLQLNEETFWSGFPCDEYNSPETLAHLDEMRRLILEGNYAQGEALCNRYFKCGGLGHRDQTGGFGSYQTAGELVLSLPASEGENYRRTLYLDEGRVEILTGRTVREYVVSPTYDTAAIRIRGLSGVATLTYERENAAIFTRDGEILAIGRLPLAYAVLIRYRQKGDTLTVFLTAATAYRTDADPKDECIRRLDAAEAVGFSRLAADTADYFTAGLGRAGISVCADERRHIPTDCRLASPRGDEGLFELYFNFGRYLLLASSRGKLPANLQGIWCRDYLAPWSADYHININIQMNYWIAELCGLSALCEPLFSYIEMLAESGKKTARVLYDCPGWVAHHQTNPWGYTSLGYRPLYGAFVTAGAWCLYHIRERYLFGNDTEILRRFLPVIRGAVEFFSAYLVKDPKTGYLVTVPASSPENSFLDPKTGSKVSLSAGPTMDNSIIRGLMTQYLEALEALGLDEPLAARAREILASLPPLSIGKHGTVMEWAQDFDEAEPGHRHISQLYALYPAAEITPSTPALYAAAKKTIERRLANGGGHTGWSRAWIINFYARLRNGEAAHENLVALLEKSTLKNMFDNHPPFQIDGNFGGAAGIAEMLLASHDGIIDLLPALPAAWQDGEFFGLCARGGFTVSARWEAGRVVFCRIEGQNGTCGRVRINGECIDFTAPFSFG